MKKILLISDTHGDLDVINPLAEKVNADYVIHAGDFGFYDLNSIYRLSHRELRLLIKHSPYQNQYQIDANSNRQLLQNIIIENKLLGTFQDYLVGAKSFTIPVYAVWGNHEDIIVIKNLLKDKTIKNLNLLHSETNYSIEFTSGVLNLFGIGGNFLPSKKLLRTPIAGQAGKVFSTLHEYGMLYERLKKTSNPSVFVSHVSPGKEPLLARMLTHFKPDFWVSGHMGAPYACVWNQFTIREFEESIAWFDSQLNDFEKLIENVNLTKAARIAAELILKPIQKSNSWFKKLWNINLPDIAEGYAVMTIENNRISLETKAHGILIDSK